MRYIPFSALALLFVSLTANAGTPVSQMQFIHYSIGTGFFITHDGYALTNYHVVRHCKDHISIAGAMQPTPAYIESYDESLDLALLKTEYQPAEVSSFNSQKQPMRAGERVITVGYPGASWQTGSAVTGEARILDLKGPTGEEQWLQFSDSVKRGNSGGPLLDGAGNVVGIVAAKAKVTSFNPLTEITESVTRSDVAIALPVVRAFLDAHGVGYQQADSGIYLSTDSITDKAGRFVINIRCRTEKEES